MEAVVVVAEVVELPAEAETVGVVLVPVLEVVIVVVAVVVVVQVL